MRSSRSCSVAGLVIVVVFVGVLANWTLAGPPYAPAASTHDGLTYGGYLGNGRDVWLRLRPDRGRIASLVIESEVPASGCTKPGVSEDKRSVSIWTGSEADHPIAVRTGRFTTRTSDTYSYSGYAFVEKARITGVFTAGGVKGTIEVKQVATPSVGAGGFECTMPPTRWSASD